MRKPRGGVVTKKLAARGGTTLPRVWPFPQAAPTPLTKRQQRDIMLRESEKAPF
jgi:hypothetical protein